MNEGTKLQSVTELLKGTFEQYKQHFNVLVPIMLIAGVGLYLQTIAMFMGTGVVTSNPYGAAPQVAFNAGGGILMLIATVIYAIGMIWGFSAVVNRVIKLDQPMGVKDAFMNAKPYIWPIFLTGLIGGILTLIGFILVIIPGIIVAVWFSFAIYIVVAENKRGMEALKASKAYVEGYWWSVFGRAIVVGILVAIVAGVIGSISNAILGYKIGMLVQNVISLGLAPFAVLYSVNIYKNLKSIKGSQSSAPSAPVAPATPAAI